MQLLFVTFYLCALNIFSTPKLDKVVENPAEFFNLSPADHPHLENIVFGLEDIEESIGELSADSAAGQDGVPS